MCQRYRVGGDLWRCAQVGVAAFTRVTRTECHVMGLETALCPWENTAGKGCDNPWGNLGEVSGVGQHWLTGGHLLHGMRQGNAHWLAISSGWFLIDTGRWCSSRNRRYVAATGRCDDMIAGMGANETRGASVTQTDDTHSHYLEVVHDGVLGLRHKAIMVLLCLLAVGVCGPCLLQTLRQEGRHRRGPRGGCVAAGSAHRTAWHWVWPWQGWSMVGQAPPQVSLLLLRKLWVCAIAVVQHFCLPS